MKTLLTIDTASSRCAVALLCGESLTERASEEQRQAAQRTLPMIAELLLDAGVTATDIDLIGVVVGPGSFTGVRIGVAIAQGLSMSCRAPVVPLSSLALLALAALTETAFDGVLVSEEARDGELYFAAYRRSDSYGAELVGREQVAAIECLDALPANLADVSWCLAGRGWDRQADILLHLACSAASKPLELEINNSLIAKLTGLRFDCSEAVDAAALRPNYVKEQLDYT